MRRFIVVLFISILFFNLSTINVNASHSWGGYHWARISNPFNLKLGDNLTSAWKPYLTTTSNDWSVSSVLDTSIVTGQAKKNCSPTSGRVEACNKNYGNNGWLGLAQIWVSGSHITQGLTKMNDTYFNTAKYNTSAWKNLVMCQEVGHTLGLDHQDEIFNNANLGTCMDYTNDPSTNQHPNKHDYDQLEVIYLHLDAFTTLTQTFGQTAKQTALENLDNQSEWGKMIRNNGKIAEFERQLFNGSKLHTFVIWAE